MPPRARYLLAVLLPAALWAGCDTLGSNPDSQLRREALQQRAQWQAQGIDHYVLTYLRVCTCPAYEAGPFDVVVHEGARRSASYQDRPIGADSLDRYFTVEGLFDFIDRAFAENPVRASLRFDPERNFPTFIFFDYQRNRTGEEDIISVTRLEELPGTAARRR